MGLTSMASAVVAKWLVFPLVCAAVLLAPSRAGPVTLPSDQLKHVLLRESEGYHDEVWAPLLTDLAASPFIRTTFSRQWYRFDMPNITERIRFHNPPVFRGFGYPDTRQFDMEHPQEFLYHGIDYLLTVSCDADMLHRPDQFKHLFDQTNVHLLCVNHNSHDQTGPVKHYNNVTKAFIDADRITFIVLGEHVGKNLNRKFHKLGSKPIHYEVYIPVFDLPEDIQISEAEEKRKQFVIQGNFESGRRDYNSVYMHFRQGLATFPANTPPSDKPRLVLIGSGTKPEVPEDIAPFVDVHVNLDYPAFYKTLSRSSVVLTAFASPAYYSDKCSSTINAAIIGSTVIVGDQRLLDSYTFLDDRVVFMTKDGESDVRAAMRFLAASPAERRSRRKYLQHYRQGIIRQNRALLDRLINPEAVAHSKAPGAVIGKYIQSVQSVAGEHPHSSGAGVAACLGLLLTFFFRGRLIKLYRSVTGRHPVKRTVSAAGEYIPVSMSEVRSPAKPRGMT